MHRALTNFPHIKTFTMTRIISCMFLFALATTSCKKDTGNTDPNSICKITTIQSASGPGYELEYAPNGKLKAAIYGGNSVTAFAYLDSFITAVSTSNGNFFSKTVYTINSNALVRKSRIEYDQAGTNWAERVYEYSGTELMKSTLTKSSGSISISTYTWSNGNLVKRITKVDGAPNQELTYEYYTDKPYQPGDAWHLDIATSGVETIRPKNLLKKVTMKHLGLDYTETTSYAYEFDSSGKIKSMTESGENGDNTYTYEFECKQY